MHPDLRPCIYGVWLLGVLVWVAGAFAAKRTARAQTTSSRLIQVSLSALAFLLLLDNTPPFALLTWRFVPLSSVVDYTGVVFTVVGVAVAIWARFYLGSNWSGSVTIKQDHQLIRTGPYAIVRNPIYAGLELAILGTALAIGEVRGLAAACVALTGMLLKCRSEEEFMTQQFGAEYLQYKKDVRAMIPFIW
jgi:protein-S-isoprenylcysteine O-methyltransferase Ste14